jgi:hypothetical protein
MGTPENQTQNLLNYNKAKTDCEQYKIDKKISMYTDSLVHRTLLGMSHIVFEIIF